MNGNWPIGMDSYTAQKAAFVMLGGVVKWTRMPFGIASAPASFQDLITQVLKGLNYKISFVYVDDIFVFNLLRTLHYL